MEAKKIINRVVAIFLCSTLFFTGLVLFWQTDRGLGLADEGIYILASRYPEEIQQNVSAIYTYLGGTFELVNHSLAAFRSMWIIIMLLSSIVLWFGFYRILDRLQVAASGIGSAKVLSFGLVAAGTFFHYLWSYVTPSYYTVTAVGINLFTGLVLASLALAEDEGRLGRACMFSVFAGIVLGATLFFKFPTAITMGVMATTLLSLWRSMDLRIKGRIFIFGIIGFIAWFAIYDVFVQNLGQAWGMFQEGWTLYQTLGYHSPAAKLLAYPKESAILLYTGFFLFLPCYLLLAPAYLLQRRASSEIPPKNFEKGVTTLVLATVLMAVAISGMDGFSVAGAERFTTAPVAGRTLPYLAFAIAWILLLLAVWLVLFRCKTTTANKRKNVWLTILVLSAMPFAGSVGTSNPIYNVIVFYAAPWFCVIFMLLVLIHREEPKFVGPIVLPMSIFVIGAYASSQVVQGSIFQPAQLKPHNMLEQTVATQVGEPPVVLKLDPGTHELVAQLSEAAMSLGFVRGGDIIAFSELPSLVYALGGRSPGHPVFPCCLSAEKNDYSKMALTFAPRERLEKSLILLGETKLADVSEILNSIGLRFPENYHPPLIVTAPWGREYSFYKPIE
ncbi:hypothetical protein P3W70_17565 [Achromobacter denitrificans]|uniref:hypothetical protein n=1 Tax=Achromobacter denitrificans TaxID=32002 RepID=UPI0023E86C3A|nr:hypothetical protein [Achromobacter denitrificans]MDF3860169.1 hypothetical protein [Achromobacter denitrificans]